MQAAAVERHLGLPAGVDPATGAFRTLRECLDESASAAHLHGLTREQQVALVKARWEAGEWHDIIYDTDAPIDLARGIRELEAGTPMGNQLLAVALRAIEMVTEDIARLRETR